VIAVAALLGGYWVGVRELVTEVRARVSTTLSALGVRRPVEPRDAGEYIVLPPPTER
jgi:hypothetical protein